MIQILRLFWSNLRLRRREARVSKSTLYVNLSEVNR